MDTDDPYSLASLANIDLTFYHFSLGTMFGLVIFFILLFISALISGSEVAYFSLRPSDLIQMKEIKSGRSDLVLKLINIPEKLLGTILVTNNFVNVGIVILSTLFFVYDPTSEPGSFAMVNFSKLPVLGFIFQVVIVTFFLLLFGEILPKLYATQKGPRFALIMSFPLNILEKIFRPVTAILISSTSIVKKRISKKKQNLSMDDLSEALDLPTTEIDEDEKILKGIAQFGKIDVKGHNILIERSGHLEADISANDIIIKGYVKGNMNAQGKILIHSTARMIGDIKASTVSIMEGAQFKGSIQMKLD